LHSCASLASFTYLKQVTGIKVNENHYPRDDSAADEIVADDRLIPAEAKLS
jgi:hypothetical protein